jgi:5-methyltetrahydrofolate--homocysteine methyltransferase
MSHILEKIRENVVAGRLDSQDEGFDGTMEGQPGVTELVRQAIEEGVDTKDILMKGLNPGMEEVGRFYEEGEYLIPDMLAAAECVGEAMNILEPHLAGEDIKSRGKFIIATVDGDLHDIGKNIVATMLKGSGFEVHDLGTGVRSKKIVDAVKEIGAQYVGLSALLTTTMKHMQEVVDLLKKENLRDRVKVLIGGAPISKEFAQKIGADFYCTDAFDALEKLARA